MDDTYTYTTSNQRLIREHGTTITLYLAGMEATWDGTTTTITRYPTIAGTTVATHTKVIGGSTSVAWNCGNMQNSTTCQAPAPANANPPVPARKRYTPYGDDRNTTTFATTDHGFLGQPEDTTGLTYLNNRYHDPQLAAFTTVDPLVGKTAQPYLYASGSPVSLSDPTGLQACSPIEEFGCGPVMDGDNICAVVAAWSGCDSGPPTPEGVEEWLDICTSNFSDCHRRYESGDLYGWGQDAWLAFSAIRQLLALGFLEPMDPSCSLDVIALCTSAPLVAAPELIPEGYIGAVPVVLSLEDGKLAVGLRPFNNSVCLKAEGCLGICLSIGNRLDGSGAHRFVSVSGIGLGGDVSVVATNGGACEQAGWGMGGSVSIGVLVVGYSVSARDASGEWDSFNMEDGQAVAVGIGLKAKYTVPFSGGWSHTWMSGC